MSYKDGIPLLTTFDEDVDMDEDYFVSSRPRKCKRRNILLVAIVCLAAVLLVGLAVSVSLGVTLKSSSSLSTDDGHGVSSGGVVMSSGGVVMSSGGVVMSSEDLVMSSEGMFTSPMPSPSSDLPSATDMPPSATDMPPSSVVMTMSLDLSSSAHVVVASSAVASSSSAVVSSSSAVAGSSSAMASSSSVMPSPSTTMEMLPSLLMTTPMATPLSSVSISLSVTMTPSPTPIPPAAKDCSDNDTLCPSPKDARRYNFTVLENGLRVVVISDPDTDLAGASLNVAAGAFNDPDDFLGLSHFCEHMLFLGTKKYPGESEYSAFLSSNGGSDNAYTSTQETNYHFRVNADFLELPLDMLAHFFIDPLLTESSVQSELFAVNQEHEKNLHSDGWKLWQLLKHVSNPEHPFSKFSTGNFDTLNKSGLYDELRRYYNSSYVANHMNLVVYGREDISVLQQWAERSFSNVLPSLPEEPPASYNTTAFPSNYTGRLIRYYPEASTDVLTMFWQTPSLQGQRRYAIAEFLTRYLGDEGRGSLLRYLQMRKWASDLQAGVEVDTDSFYLFSLQITLTGDGLDHVSEVIRAAFYFVRLLADLEEQDFQRMWDDFLNVGTLNFDYAEKLTPNEYAVSITQVMRVEEWPADFLPNPRRYLPDYDHTLNIANHFTPNNTIIFIGTHNTDDSTLDMSTEVVPLPPAVLDDTEPYYNTSFENIPIPDDLLTYWGPNDTLDAMYSELSLASRNSFVPEDLNLLPPPPQPTVVPQLVNGSDTNETWFLQDLDFTQPRLNFRCELRSATVEPSAHWISAARLFAAMVMAEAKFLLYEASEVGYSYQVSSTERGLVLSFGGLSDREIIQRIVNLTMSTLVNVDALDEDIYTLVQGDIQDELSNYNYTSLPYRYTPRYYQTVLLERPYWTNEDILDAMGNLSFDGVKEFAKEVLLRSVSVSCLAHGNVNEDIATSYSNIITDLLSDAYGVTTPVPGFLRTRVLLNDPLSGNFGGDYGVALPALNPMDDNSVVNVIYQAGPVCLVDDDMCSDESVLRSVQLSLLRLIIKDPCFTRLRTEEKLGYVAYCTNAVHQGEGSFQTLVQSEVFSPEHVLDSIDAFLSSFYDDVISAQNFSSLLNQSVGSLMQTLVAQDLQLETKTDRLWEQVLSGQHQFNFRQQQIDMLSSVNIEDFEEFEDFVDDFRNFYYSTILETDTRHRLVLVVYGKDKYFELPVENLIDYQQLDHTDTELPVDMGNSI